MAGASQQFDPAVFARLAKLELSEEERSRYAREFQVLLGYFSTIAKADVSNVAPMVYAVEQPLRSREDLPRAFENRAAILENAPAQGDGGFFKVPKVIEQ